jgi:hypothetical protein
MEADDDGARRLGEQNVALGDRADAAMDDLHLHLGRRELLQRVGERLGRAALIRLDDDAELATLARTRLRHEVFERDMKSSSDTTPRDVRRLLASRSRRWRRCASSRAAAASSTTMS